jgi:hypothetical protein
MLRRYETSEHYFIEIALDLQPVYLTVCKMLSEIAQIESTPSASGTSPKYDEIAGLIWILSSYLGSRSMPEAEAGGGFLLPLDQKCSFI